DPARAPADRTYTMFSGALLRILTEGDKAVGPILSLKEIGDLAREMIREEFAEEAVRPQVHVPDQRDGDVSLVPLFPNAALRVSLAAQVTAVASRVTSGEARMAALQVQV